MSSFVKLKKDNTIDIRGVRTSIRNGQVTSSGSDSFDFVIGGGIEISSIILLGEDKFGRHSNVLTRLFLADGFHHQHKIYFASLDEDPRETIKDIPQGSEQQKDPSKPDPESSSANDDLRIAFRYQAAPKIDSVQRGSSSGITYDLSKKVSSEQIEKYPDISYFSFTDWKNRGNSKSHFEGILDDVQSLASENKNNLLRICISSIGSPLWYSENFSENILKFLVRLKSVLRYNENVVCLLTMPLHLVNVVDEQLVFKIRKLVDININLESFDDVERQTNAVFKQYHGLLHIKKLQTLTALQSHKPESFDLAFKLKSHRFVIEKLHLPPELQDPDQSHAPSMSCASTGGMGSKALDF